MRGELGTSFRIWERSFDSLPLAQDDVGFGGGGCVMRPMSERVSGFGRVPEPALSVVEGVRWSARAASSLRMTLFSVGDRVWCEMGVTIGFC